MFFIKKRETHLIDFLAQLSAISECATQEQMDAYLAELPTRFLKVANRFLGQWAVFSSHIPRSDSTGGRSNG